VGEEPRRGLTVAHDVADELVAGHLPGIVEALRQLAVSGVLVVRRRAVELVPGIRHHRHRVAAPHVPAVLDLGVAAVDQDVVLDDVVAATVVVHPTQYRPRDDVAVHVGPAGAVVEVDAPVHVRRRPLPVLPPEADDVVQVVVADLRPALGPVHLPRVDGAAVSRLQVAVADLVVLHDVIVAAPVDAEPGAVVDEVV